MRIYVDADSCPVKEEIASIASDLGVHAVFIAALQHAPREIMYQSFIEDLPSLKDSPHVVYVLVEREKESVDIEIMNRVSSGDVVVTGDFGLAAVTLEMGAAALSPTGRVYNQRDINELLDRRHLARQLRNSRRGKKHLKKNPPLSNAVRLKFVNALRRLTEKSIKIENASKNPPRGR